MFLNGLGNAAGYLLFIGVVTNLLPELGQLLVRAFALDHRSARLLQKRAVRSPSQPQKRQGQRFHMGDPLEGEKLSASYEDHPRRNRL